MEYSEVTITILSLLNNAKDLIFHSDRQSANKVIKAVEIYAKENGFNLNDETFKTFSRILIDSRENTLNGLIDDIALEAISTEKKQQRQNKIKKMAK